MSRRSVRLRLLAAGTAAVLLSLAIAAVGLGLLFERHARRLAIAELSFDLDELAAGLERSGGAVSLATPPSDPRFSQPFSGRYWQVEIGNDLLRSRSLWDGHLALPPAPGGAPRQLVVRGPRGDNLLVYERQLRLGERTVRAAVALDAGEIRTATRSFLRDSVPWLGLLAAVLIGAGWLQVTVGLRPLARVGSRVAKVRSGAASRLGSDFPDEVQPLAAEVDALIEAREAETVRARARAADLAHGLKTPLQALIGEAGRLRAAGADADADGIEEIVLAMRRHIDRELARARIARTSASAASDPATVVARLLGVLRRTADGGRIAWSDRMPPGLRARIDPDDLTEALGALLENAARHAAARVEISAAAAGGRVAIRISDDGPGIPPGQLDALIGRGMRLDQAGSAAGSGGTGLGLAIAREIAEAAGGSLALRNRSPGLDVFLDLPAAAT